VTRPGGGREGEGGGRGIAASQSNKAAGGTRALQRVGAPGHRLERLPCTAAAAGGVWREAAQRRLAVEILRGGVGGEEEGH